MENQFLEDVRSFVAAVLRRKAVPATTLLLSLAVATVINYTTRPLYQASVQILVDEQKPDVLPGREVVAQRIDAAFLNTQYLLLRSRELAEAVVEKLGLNASAELKAGPLMSPWERLQRTILRKPVAPPAGTLSTAEAGAIFRSRVVVEPEADSRLINVRFIAYDPVIAALAANTLAQTYLDLARQRRSSTSEEATDWLEQRIQDQQAKVEEADRALREYSQKAGAGSAGLEDSRAMLEQRVASLQSSALSARSERIAKESVVRQLRSLAPQAVLNSPHVAANPGVQALRARLSELQGEEARLGESLGEKHPDMVRVRSEIKLTQQRLRTEIDGLIASLEAEAQAALQQEQGFESSLATLRRQGASVAEQSVDYVVLKRDLEIAQQLLQQLMRRAKESGLESTLDTNTTRILEKAEIPQGPFRPNRRGNLWMATLIGLGLGLSIIYLLEHVDVSLKQPGDVKEHVGLPLLGAVPDASLEGGNLNSAALTTDPRSPLAEAYRLVRTNLLFSTPEAGCRVLLVTSVSPSEGKSTTVVNLATALALNGARVLVIDGDLRRPTLHTQLRVASSPGLSDLIVAKQPLAATRGTAVEHLDVLPCGYVPPNPTELLGSSRLAQLLSEFRERYDVVLIDSPPVLSIADAPVLSRLADAIILVAQANKTSRYELKRVAEQLAGVGGRILGVVLNRVKLQRDAYYNTYYGQRDSGAETARKPRDKAAVRSLASRR